MRKLLVAAALLGMVAPAFAQAVINPTKVEFQVSADHAATLPDGSAVVDHYEIRYYQSGAQSPVQMADLGKPSPDVSGKAVADIVGTLAAIPFSPSVQYVAKMVAVGPTGTSAESDPSNPFVRASAPGRVTTVVVTRP